MPPIARVDSVSLRYGDVKALEDVFVEIPAEIMVGLIGPDGAGKSSLLALISGARRLQAGRIEVFGVDMKGATHRAQAQPRIAYMPQGLGRNLYPSLSAAENVDSFGKLFGLRAAERKTRIDELLAATGLADFRDRPAAKLSGGMKQKLGLCCALIHDPDLLILDEPTTGVDPLSRLQFWALIDTLRARRPGMSVVVATAYMEEAERFDWLVAMDAGRIVGTGRPEKLKGKSANLEEAFINLLPEAKRKGHRTLVIPPGPKDGTGWAIEAEGLTMRFGEFTAVDHVDLSIRAGEIFGFLGSNGCGKTTTMKMLTGLLQPTEGRARLFGREVDAMNPESRRQVGYMSQSFSLYGELTVFQNLDLHARLFNLPRDRIKGRVSALMARFGLEACADLSASALPLGMRQRLSLAVAVVHEPRLLILDEPTSGVDPVARDSFWQLLATLSREQRVTIFISTHFMNEAERCDRISLMHAGKVLASDTPAALRAAQGANSLEEAFISYLKKGGADRLPQAAMPAAPRAAGKSASSFSISRLLGIAYRESLELRRDPVRLSFALIGSVLLMFVLGYGISMDVEHLRFAVLDRDHSPESRAYVRHIAGSRYFVERRPITDAKSLEVRMSAGELAIAIEIPPGFGRDLRIGRHPEIGVWIDGALPYRGEMALGYIRGINSQYVGDMIIERKGNIPPPVEISLRYRYNQDFRSIYAMVPAVIPLLLVFIPSILMALGVVREKELGSIVNLYVTPVTRLEFLLGKQLPYVAVSMMGYVALVLQAVFAFGVPVKGSLAALTFGTLLYVMATTGLGLLISTFTRTQTAAIFGTAIATMLPAVQFSGLTTPVSSLDGAAYWAGQFFPASHYLVLSRGVFTKALDFSDLTAQFAALAAFIPVLTALSVSLLRKQET